MVGCTCSILGLSWTLSDGKQNEEYTCTMDSVKQSDELVRMNYPDPISQLKAEHLQAYA